MNDASEAMMISTLPHSLIFQDLERNFVPLKFCIKEKGFESRKELDWDELLNSKLLEAENRIWLLSSFSGSGKSTVMRELSFQLQRMLACKIKVFLVGLSDTVGLFTKVKTERRIVPSLASVVSIATRIREMEIQNLIEQKKIMLMLDGFDEMCPFYRDQVLDVLAEAVEKKVPILISTQPHEEVAILSKLGKGNQVFKLKILPLDWRKQIDFLMMTSHKSEEECKLQIYFYRRNGLEDILGNPLHLKMIAELGDLDYKKGIDLYEIYEKILEKKLRFALKELQSIILEKELNICERELRIAAVKFLCGDKTDILKYPNNGIVTISNGRAQFVHQTFAEFLVAAHFIDCLLFDGFENPQRPFEILNEEFRQVRKFVDLRISMSVGDEKLNFLTSLEKYLKNSLTKSSIENVILEERLVNFSSAAANLVTFNAEESKLNYVTSDQILVLASKRVENCALGLLKKGAYEKLEDPNRAAVEILRDAIENNFAQLFTEMGKKFAGSMDLVRNNMKIKKTYTLAAYRNHHKVLFLVLEQKILDQGELQVALKSAVRGNSAECVEVLIEHGARTASLDESNFDHLNSKTTEALLKTKDEPELKLASRIFNRSLDDEYCNAEVAKYLLERFGDEENEEFEVSSSALFDVATCEDFDDALEILCRWLVEKRGFQVREKDWTGRNAFHCAAKKGNLRLLKYFLEKDPKLTKTLTDKEENAMHLSP
ncbi:uncharacterized protein LOC132201312 isoform X2 [Neocloeon triangulifer]|uniref:uncharacterized protein LOC132201312 isoform X2 n=1 Tax=Neocloeon triangulifer TaxID=2078957 RepID=UPI00286F3210|nr:uncharacterized protein LOC132201312 isoform X2 [Neocloeon triangulifer]